MNSTQTQLQPDSQKKNGGDKRKTVSYPRLAASLITTALMILLTVLAIRGGSSFPGPAPQVRYSLDDLLDWIAPRRVTICIILSVLAGVFMYVKIGRGLFSKIYTGVFAVVIPPLSFIFVEAYNRGFWHVGAPLSYKIAEPFSSMFLLNILLFYLFYLFLAFLAGSFRVGYSIASALLMLVAVINYYVVQFRGNPIVPWDLLSVRTAGNVAGNYDYTVKWQMLFATFGFVFLILISIKMNAKFRFLPVRLGGCAIVLAALILVVSGLQSDEMKTFWGIDTTLFTPNVRCTKNGFWPAFLSNLSFLNVKKPDGYSASKAEEIAQEAENSYEASASPAAKQNPNIIIIMNEAFSDLSVLGDFNTSEDYMPGFRKLMEEYTSGHLMVSVKGGNTANTEYECLSSDTMAFLPPGCVVFQQYIHSDIPTTATYLKEMGYRTIGMHPYNGRMLSMLIFAFFPLFALFAQPMGVHSAWWPAVFIGLAGAGHQAWSANLFSTIGDMFPKSAVATITGIGGMAGGIGSAIVQKAAGALFTKTEAMGAAFNFLGFEGKQGGYFVMFCFCGIAYLVAWIIMKSLVPKYKPVKI